MNALQKLIYLEQDSRKFGFDWPDHFMILDQIIDECREVRDEIDQGSNKEKLQEEIGDLLHSVISLCVFSGFDVVETISKTNAKFSRRMQLLKELTKQKGLENLQGQSIDFMLNLWREVKKIEHYDMNENLNKSQLDSFDELFVGNPVDIERNLSALLSEAEQHADKSIYLQILSQIALAQAMQQKFDIAHQTLDEAERLLEPHYQLAKIRLLLERGRVYHQSDRLDQARSFFIQSYDLSKLSPEFDFHTVNASHMVAIVEKHAEGKIEWNKRAINLAKQTKDERCHAWLGPIYNNLAQNYIEAEKYLEALQSFEKCKAHAEERGDQIVIRGALWGMGRALRGLNKLDQALDIQNDLLKEYEKISDQRLLPMELIYVGRGLVYEELAEIYFAKESGQQSQKYARLSYEDLSKDAWMKKLYPKRIERMLELGKL